MSKSGKGSQYERDVCRTLSLWWSKGKDDDLFWRSSMSGGRATVRSKKGKRTAGHYGDIVATDGRGRKFLKMFTVELKRGYKDANIHTTLDKTSNKLSEFEKFVQQAIAAKRLAGTPFFLLIHKRDRKREMVYTDFFHNDLHTPLCCVRMKIGKKDKFALYGYRLETWLRQNSPATIVRYLQDLKDCYG